MKIDHTAIWVKNLEKMKDFYVKYFDVSAGPLYVNKMKAFSSYFLSFQDGSRLEIMSSPEVSRLNEQIYSRFTGYSHIAVSLGSRERVIELTAAFAKEGISIPDGPRTTGDGYFESVILDPEGNRIELTV